MRSHPPRQDARAIATEATVPSLLASAELATGEQVAGRFRIEGLLGVGGMGVVYRAHDEQLGIDVALKLLRPELAAQPEAFERFRQELLLARQVSSPYVVRIHDLVTDDRGRRLISMDYVPGCSLEQHLDAHGALAPDAALAIARQVALGLAAAHASGIVHRDLKPANVLLRDDGRACISDFGVARSAGAVRATGTGLVVGTPDYVSPEQARGETVGPRSDLYALGLILYEMLTGRRAFDDATPAESLARRQLRAPVRLRRLRPELAPWIERLAARLLDPHPLRRLRDAGAVVAAIDAQHVRRAPPALRLVAPVALALATLGTVGWWGYRHGASVGSPAAPAVLPLDLAALPLVSADAELAAAFSALVGASLLAGDVATADRRRVMDSLERLGYDARTAAGHPERVLAELGARRVLSGSLEREGTQWRAVLRLDRPGATPRTVRSSTTSLSALAPTLRGLLVELALIDPRAGLGTVWPADEAALRAFGRGVLATDAEAALEAYAEALRREPRFAAAWWQRLQAARRVLPAPRLTELAAAARDALRDVRGRDADRVRALVALVEGDPRLAAERFAPLAAGDPHDHHTGLLLAEALEAAGERAQATAQLQRMTAEDPQDADAWLLLGQGAIRAGEAQRAVDDYLVRARMLFTRLRDQRGLADALNALGLGSERLGQSAAAIDYFSQAAELRRTNGDRRGAISSHRNLAWAHAVTGNAAAADAELGRARAIAVTLDDPALQADIANDAGLIAEERGDFSAALPHFREALALREAQADALGAGEAAINLGFALLQTGAFADARSYLEQAERAAVAADDRTGIIRAQQLLGALHMARGEYDQAAARLQRALRLAEEVNLAEERAVVHAERAELARQQRRYEEALAEAGRALALFRDRDDVRGMTEARLRTAAVHRDRGEWDAAERALAPVVDAAPANREQAAMLAVRLGEIALGRGDASTALRQAGAALGDAEAAHSLPAQAQARLLRARALSAGGQRAQAIAELARADGVLRNYPAAALRREHDRIVALLADAAPAQAAGRKGARQ